MKLSRKYVGRPTRKNITESALIEKADHFPTTVQFEDNDEKQELLAELDLLEQHLDEHNDRYLRYAFNFDQLNDEFPSFVEHVVVYVVAEGYDTNEEKWANTTYQALKRAWNSGDLDLLFTTELCYGYINYIRKCLRQNNPIKGYTPYTPYVTPTTAKKVELARRNLASVDVDELIDRDDKDYERLADGIEDGMFTLNDLEPDEYDKVLKILNARAKEERKNKQKESVSEGVVNDDGTIVIEFENDKEMSDLMYALGSNCLGGDLIRAGGDFMPVEYKGRKPYIKVLNLSEEQVKEIASKYMDISESLTEANTLEYDAIDLGSLADEFIEQLKALNLKDSILAAMTIKTYYENTELDKDKWQKFNGKQVYWQDLAKEFAKRGYKIIAKLMGESNND